MWNLIFGIRNFSFFVSKARIHSEPFVFLESFSHYVYLMAYEGQLGTLRAEFGGQGAPEIGKLLRQIESF
jgi:hypothetical protein